METTKTKAAGLDARAALENTQLDYAPLHSLVQANIAGQGRAAAAIDEIGACYADPDTLYLALKTLMPAATGIEVLAALRGFCRTTQKHIERGSQ
jgi:hypothetical protein